MAVPRLTPPSSRLPRKKSTRSTPMDPAGALESIATPEIMLLPASTRAPGVGLASEKSRDAQLVLDAAGAVCANAGRVPIPNVAATASGPRRRTSRDADEDMQSHPFPVVGAILVGPAGRNWPLSSVPTECLRNVKPALMIIASTW